MVAVTLCLAFGATGRPGSRPFPRKLLFKRSTSYMLGKEEPSAWILVFFVYLAACGRAAATARCFRPAPVCGTEKAKLAPPNGFPIAWTGLYTDGSVLRGLRCIDDASLGLALWVGADRVQHCL